MANIKDIIQNISNVAKNIYKKIKQVKANQEQCRALGERVRVIERAINELDNVPDGRKEIVAESLSGLKMTLDDVNDYVSQFIPENYSQGSWFDFIVNLVTVDTQEKKLAELNQNLLDDIVPLHLEITIQKVINYEKDVENQRKDSQKNLEILRALADIPAHVERSMKLLETISTAPVIFDYIRGQKVERIKSYLSESRKNAEKYGFNIDFVINIIKDSTGKKPLHVAIEKGSLPIIEELLIEGADVNSYDDDHNTPLHIAVSRDSMEVINLLLGYDASLESNNTQKVTPLQLAEQSGKDEIAALLRTRQEWQKTVKDFRFNKVIRLIKDAFHEIEPARGRDKLLFIGPPGSTKSTTASYMFGAKYEQYRDEAGTLGVKLLGGQETFKTGEGMRSQTLYPQVKGKEDLSFVYCDLAGLLDSRGTEIQIATTSSIHLLGRLPGKIKGIVVFIEESALHADRGKRLKDTAKTLAKMVQQNPNLMDSVYFVITKVCFPPLCPEIEPKAILDKYVIDRSGKYFNRLIKDLESQKISNILSVDDAGLLYMLKEMQRRTAQIIIPNICDSGSSRRLMEDTFKGLEAHDSSLYDFLSHDESLQKFIKLLSTVASGFFEKQTFIRKEIHIRKQLNELITQLNYERYKRELEQINPPTQEEHLLTAKHSQNGPVCSSGSWENSSCKPNYKIKEKHPVMKNPCHQPEANMEQEKDKCNHVSYAEVEKFYDDRIRLAIDQENTIWESDLHKDKEVHLRRFELNDTVKLRVTACGRRYRDKCENGDKTKVGSGTAYGYVTFQYIGLPTNISALDHITKTYEQGQLLTSLATSLKLDDTIHSVKNHTQLVSMLEDQYLKSEKRQRNYELEISVNRELFSTVYNITDILGLSNDLFLRFRGNYKSYFLAKESQCAEDNYYKYTENNNPECIYTDREQVSSFSVDAISPGRSCVVMPPAPQKLVTHLSKFLPLKPPLPVMDGQLIPHGKWHFYSAAWDRYAKPHHVTGEYIFTYRVFNDGQEVGSASFYKHPLLCRSIEGDRHNVLDLQGILRNFTIDLSKIEDVCESLPPTKVEQLVSAASHGAQHGAIRGVANTVAYSLQKTGFSSRVQELVREGIYYGGFFSLRFCNYLFQQDPQKQDMAAAAYQAAEETASVLITSAVVKKVCDLAGEVRDAALHEGAHKKALLFGGIKRYGSYAVHGYNACRQGVAETVTSILTGGVTEAAVESIGIAGVNRALDTYNRAKPLIPAFMTHLKSLGEIATNRTRPALVERFPEDVVAGVPAKVAQKRK